MRSFSFLWFVSFLFNRKKRKEMNKTAKLRIKVIAFILIDPETSSG